MKKYLENMKHMRETHGCNIFVLCYHKNMSEGVFVVNPVSGGGRAKRAFLHFRKLLGRQCDVVVSTSKGYLLNEFSKLCSYRKFYVFGGDGTLNEVINAIYQCRVRDPIYITVFPSGSGNDFVKSLPYAEFVEFYPGVFRYEEGERYFLNALGTGLDAYTAYYASDVKGKYLRGIPAYAYGLIKTMILGASTTSVVDASIDIPHSLSLMSFGRGAYVGGGFYLLPHADVKKKSIAWLVARYISPFELLHQIPILFNGEILHYEKVSYGHANRIDIKLEEPKVFQVDGEIIKGVSQFSVYTADTPIYIRYIKPL